MERTSCYGIFTKYTAIHTWGEGAPNAAGHRVAQGALHPAGQDGQQHAGDPAQTLAAGEVLAPRTGNRGVYEGLLLWLPEAQHPPKPAVCTHLQVRSRVRSHVKPTGQM